MIDGCEGLDASPALPLVESLLLYLNSRVDAVLGTPSHAQQAATRPLRMDSCVADQGHGSDDDGVVRLRSSNQTPQQGQAHTPVCPAQWRTPNSVTSS